MNVVDKICIYVKKNMLHRYRKKDLKKYETKNMRFKIED